MNFLSARLPRLAQLSASLGVNATHLNTVTHISDRLAQVRETFPVLLESLQEHRADPSYDLARIDSRIAEVQQRSNTVSRLGARIDQAIADAPAETLRAFRDSFYPKALVRDPRTGIAQATLSLYEGIEALTGDGVKEPTQFGFRGSVVPVDAGESAASIEMKWFAQRIVDLEARKAQLTSER